MEREHIHFITGRLAESALRGQVERLAERCGFAFTIDVLPITVAALMTPRWIAKHWRVPLEASRVVLPGYCAGDLGPLQASLGERNGPVTLECGPHDLRQLPAFFGRGDESRRDYGRHNIQIIAEINHAPRLSLAEIVRVAKRLRAEGADFIDVGCEPDGQWEGVADCVKALRDEGLRVSIDSLSPGEISAATRAGAELVLSVNSSNRSASTDWGCEVVAIPDDPKSLAGFDETVEWLDAHRVPCRLDPILEPIGCGFAASLGRYLEIRRRYPAYEMMMGIGNITELTDADSAAINVVLLGFCQEVGIRSVLTTQVITWARSSVRECDLARRLVHFAVERGTPPKHLEPDLVMLRDPQVAEHGPEFLATLASSLRDSNYRLFAERGQLHLLAAGVHLQHADAFRLFEQLQATQPKNLDASHAFYLGYELAKATTALTLGKQYEQDESLRWGFLTTPETSLEITHRARQAQSTTPPSS